MEIDAVRMIVIKSLEVFFLVESTENIFWQKLLHKVLGVADIDHLLLPHSLRASINFHITPNLQ
jgi:hypothetical protein